LFELAAEFFRINAHKEREGPCINKALHH